MAVPLASSYASRPFDGSPSSDVRPERETVRFLGRNLRIGILEVISGQRLADHDAEGLGESFFGTL